MVGFLAGALRLCTLHTTVWRLIWGSQVLGEVCHRHSLGPSGSTAPSIPAATVSPQAPACSVQEPSARSGVNTTEKGT